MDPASGRGRAILQDDGIIKGMLSFHQGDKADFVAIRTREPTPSSRRKMVAISLKKPKQPRKS